VTQPPLPMPPPPKAEAPSGPTESRPPSFLRRAMARLRTSWMLSSRTRANRRVQKAQARTELVLRLVESLLEERLRPLLMQLETLEGNQATVLRLQQQMQASLELQGKQTVVREMLLEILQAVQPSAEAEISRLIGQPTAPSSPLGSPG